MAECPYCGKSLKDVKGHVKRMHPENLDEYEQMLESGEEIKAKKEEPKAAPKKPKKSKPKKSRRRKKEPQIQVDPIVINADQLSFNNDKEIDDLARYLEERIPPRRGLEEVIRNKNELELQLTKPVSKRKIKLYINKFLHKVGLRLDYRVLATFQGRKKADFNLYPRRVYEI